MTRSPLWWVFVLAVVVSPTVVAAYEQSTSTIDGPMTVFSLGFDFQVVIEPLLAVTLFVVPLSGQLANRWSVYTRTREDLGSRLKRQFGQALLIPFLVFFAGTVLLGIYAFWVAPGLGMIPRDFAAPLPGATPVTSESYATFTQLTAAGNGVYLLVFAAWKGLWAAVFSALGFLLLVLTNHRLLAFSLPLILYWVENAVLDNLHLEQFRTVSAVDPFTVTQQAIGTAFVPLLWWIGACVLLVAALRSRNRELASFQ